MEAVWADSRLDLSSARTKASVLTGYTRFQDGDILVPKITPTFEAGRSVLINGLVNGVGAGTTELHVLRPGRGVDGRFLAYVTRSHAFLKMGEGEMYGVAGQKRVDEDFVRGFPVSLPCSEEQQRIADRLDAEVALLHKLRAARMKESALLEELLASQISDTLIGNNFEVRDLSSPASRQGNQYVRLGYVSRIQSGLTIDAARPLGGRLVTRPYLRVANVQSGRLLLDPLTDVTVPEVVANRTTLRAGDVLMTEGGDLDKLGRGAVWRGQIPGCLHQNHVFAVRPDLASLDPDYLSLITQTAYARAYFESTGTKTTNLASTSSAKILAFPIPVPPLGKQRKLVQALQADIDHIGRLRSSISKQVGLLEERFRALINTLVVPQ
ncbi:restriction endonuclease subunit S [Micromonospora echinofusca]|uniref:restriction endonuclease subunit S n=1 Tax=Micromonospora echinofusca TaxID=47858 RepID=UPI0037129623